jgi:hypothetical protein
VSPEYRSGVYRALNRFGIPRADHEAAEVDESKRIHTANRDEAKPDEITALGDLTPNEARLLKQGGVAAVLEDRRFWFKEHRIQCKDRSCTHGSHVGYERKKDTPHLNETTGRPCTYCMIPSSDPERAYYNCIGVSKAERLRRDAARDYKTNGGRANAMAAALVQDRVRPETARGTEAGSEGQAEGNGAVRLPAVSRTDRTGTAEADAPEGTDTRSAETATAGQKARGATAERIAGIRERLRSGAMDGGPTDRTATAGADGSTTVQTLQAKNPARVGSRDAKAVAKAQPKLKRGRPKVHKDKREKDRKNSRAYRQRRQRK